MKVWLIWWCLYETHPLQTNIVCQKYGLRKAKAERSRIWHCTGMTYGSSCPGSPKFAWRAAWRSYFRPNTPLTERSIADPNSVGLLGGLPRHLPVSQPLCRSVSATEACHLANRRGSWHSYKHLRFHCSLRGERPREPYSKMRRKIGFVRGKARWVSDLESKSLTWTDMTRFPQSWNALSPFSFWDRHGLWLDQSQKFLWHQYGQAADWLSKQGGKIAWEEGESSRNNSTGCMAWNH